MIDWIYFVFLCSGGGTVLDMIMFLLLGWSPELIHILFLIVPIPFPTLLLDHLFVVSGISSLLFFFDSR